jgi:uncharacterized protein involved in exopolysaccharide biosynthesis
MTPGIPQPVAPPAPGNSTSRATAEALFRHRTAFVATVGVVMLATALITLFTPRSYQSEMNILVRNARPEYLISPERSNGQIAPPDVTEERINSEMEVLRSKDIADTVADRTWSAKPLSQRTEAEVKAHEKAVVEFEKHLSVEAVRKSNVIHVFYTTDTPRSATDTVDRLLAAFLAKQREIERSTGASTFFAAEADRYKAQLDQAQQALAGFQQSNGVVTVADTETTLQEQINSTEDNIRSTQTQITEAAERVASDKHQLALLPPRLSTMERSVYNTQAVEQLTALLITYQNKRTELLTRFQPTDRLVTENAQQIKDTSAALAAARANNGQESTTDINPVYQQVKSVLTTSTTDLAALRGRMNDLIAQRARLRQQLKNVEGSTVDYTTLQARVTELEGNYQLYSQKKNEARMADAMDQQQLVNVAVAERPTFSAKPYRPQILLNLALGLFTALFLGTCVVFFLELGRDTIAAPYELEAISKVPVLATVPFVAEPFPASRGGSRPPAAPVHSPDPEPPPPPPVAPQAAPEPAPQMPHRSPLPATSGGPTTAAIVTVAAADTSEQPEPLADVVAMPTSNQHSGLHRLQPLPPPSFDRRQLQTYDELEAARFMPREAVHVYPLKPEPHVERAASAPVPQAPPIEVEPLEPAEPRAYVDGRFGSTLQPRSRLSPLQRASTRRHHETTRDREGRGYVTYTIEPR